MTVRSLEQKGLARQPYHHARFEQRRRFLRFLIRNIVELPGFPVASSEDVEVPEDNPAFSVIA